MVPLSKVGVIFKENFFTFFTKERNPANTLNTEVKTTDSNRKAAWDLYVEMETRVTTQPLAPEHGDEKTALDSVYSLFQTTREILHAQGPDCVVFAKIALVILNDEVRPFTAEWHRKSLAGAFDDPEACVKFREAHESLRVVLCAYAQTLAVMAGIEDITSLSETEQESTPC